MPATGRTLEELSYIFEFIGTGVFTYMILVADQSEIEHTMCCYVIVLLLGALAGGHFNPATSIGVYASGGSQSFLCFLSVLVSQIVGAIAGLALAFVYLGE